MHQGKPIPRSPRPGAATVLAALMTAVSLTCAAQPAEAFKIGFLISGSDHGQMRPVMERLRGALLDDAALMAAMGERGYGDIWLRPSDEPFDMIQRLGAREFELAFATSVIYARQFRSRPGEPDAFQAVAYEPVFQFRRVIGDFVDPRGNGVFRRGVIFAGPASRLYGTRWYSPEVRRTALLDELSRTPLAVPDSYSATGYIYPRLMLADEWTTLTLRGPLFCRTEASVVKHVFSGLATLGACDAALLSDLAPGLPFEEILRTDLIPADPILFRAELLPDAGGADLGRELKVALQKFFNAPDAPIEGVKIEKAGRRAFEDMARALRRFDELQQPTDTESAAP